MHVMNSDAMAAALRFFTGVDHDFGYNLTLGGVGGFRLSLRTDTSGVGALCAVNEARQTAVGVAVQMPLDRVAAVVGRLHTGYGTPLRLEDVSASLFPALVAA